MKFLIYLIIPLLLIICLHIINNYIFLFPSIKETIVDEKKIMIKELTQIAINTIDIYNSTYKDSLTQAEIQKLSLEHIRGLSYGDDKKSYFWITDLTPIMIMHPYRKELEGTDLSHYEDINGTALFNHAVDLVKNNREGYLEYNWQWQDDSTKNLPKISYVKLYKEWGWIIGTGIYIDDIDIELSKFRKNELRRTLFITILLLILIISIIQYGLKIEKLSKKSIEKLQLSEEKFRNLFQDNNDIILMSTLEGVILDINKKALTTYGFKYEDVVGKKSVELIPEKYQDRILKRIQSIGTEDVEPIEIELEVNDGKTIFVEINSSISTYDDQKVILSTLRNITLRKKHEKDLTESRLHYKIVADYTSNWEYWLGTDNKFKYISPSCKRISGYDVEEFKANPKLFTDIIIPEDQEKWGTHHKNAFAFHLGNDVIEFRIINKMGELIWIEHSCQPVYDNNNNYIGVRGTNRNISIRKNAENEVKKLSKAVEQSANMVIITDIKGIIEYANEKLYITTGFAKEEVIGKTPRILKSGKHGKTFYKELWETIMAGNVWSGEICNKKKNGDLFWESILITPVIDDNNRITNFMSVKEDITEKKLADKKLFNAILETEEKERKKFAEDLHDELGPHLSGIRLYINELEDEKIKPERRNDIVVMLDTMIKEAIDKTRTISNQLMPSVLTDYGLIKALNSFCSRINNTNTIHIALNYFNQELSIDKNSEIVIYHVLIELINNTIKHAKAKNINIDFNKIGKYIDLVYKDDGLGFDLKQTIQDKKGLGLSNVLNRMKTIESTYHFESYPQKGIIFSFRILTN